MELKELKDKILEALYSALPITVLVYLMALTPWFEFSTAELITFTVGAVLLVVGIGLFSMGADLAMTPMGTHVGSGLSKQRRLGLLLFVCFVLGMLITIAEPDLQVLANQVSAVMNGTLLIYAVGFGVGAFLVIAVLKIVFRKSLGTILMLFYMLLFALGLMLAVIYGMHRSKQFGLKEDDMRHIAHLMALTAKDIEANGDYVRAEVAKLCEKYPLYQG